MESTLLTLGVLLILVGLIGQVKAKEIEVGTKNPLVRIVLGLVGVVFVSIALSKSISIPFSPASTSQPTPSPTASETVITTPSPAAPAPEQPNTKIPTATPPPSITATSMVTETPTNSESLHGEIPFIYADDFGTGITIHKVWAQNTGLNVEFQFDYTSDVDRWLSFFDPPAGDVISIQKELPAGTNSVLVVVRASWLQKVSNITVNFYIPGEELTGVIFLDFQEIRYLLP